MKNLVGTSVSALTGSSLGGRHQEFFRVRLTRRALAAIHRRIMGQQLRPRNRRKSRQRYWKRKKEEARAKEAGKAKS